LQQSESLRIRDIELRFHDSMHRPPSSSEDCIYVHKGAAFVAAMDATLERVRPKYMIEIGIHDGGSTIYWHHKYDPQRLVAFDIVPDAPFITRYLERNRLSDAVRLHLGVAQNDHERLRAAIEADFGGKPADAVIDDASHQYADTKATFETVFPFLRAGGVYLIEDWAWGHGQNWPPDEWADAPLMSPLLAELMLVCGHGSGVIDKVEINRRFAVIWRGGAEIPKDRFRLGDHYAARGFAIAL
jgi:SAM-dependent methyltransferase